MKKLIFICLLSVIFVSCGKTEPLKENNTANITFEDQAFEHIIRDNLGKPQGDITQEDMDKIQTLRIDEKEVENIQGIELCHNLTELVLNNTKIIDFTLINQIESLKTFRIINQTLSSSPEFSNKASMGYIQYENCQISRLSCIAPKVQGVIFRNCKIDDFSCENTNTKVNVLSFWNCTISSLRGISCTYAAKELNITNSVIESFGECDMNNLKTIKLDQVKFTPGIGEVGAIPKSKKKIKCTITNCNLPKLSGIKNFFGNNEISNLILSSNKITSIEGIQDISNLNLFELDLSKNDIRDLTPLCTVVSNVIYLDGNKNISCYSPVADFKGEYLNYTELYSGVDFEIPASEITFCIIKKGYWWYNIKFDVSPIEVKGQDIFVSPRYLLYECDFKCKVNQGKIVLYKKNNKIVFEKNGTVMRYKGKKYVSPYPAVVRKGVVYIPIRYFINKLGGTVKKELERKSTDYIINLPKDFFLN